jgi:GcrA cell cycle regulator
MNRGRGSWTDDRDTQLRALWTQDDPRLSTRKIAERMGMTKNAIVGRARRMKLPGRPSPILPPVLKPDGATPAANQAPRRFHPQRAATLRPASELAAPELAAPAAPALPALPARLMASRPARACRYIAGQPAGLATVYCDAPTRPGSSYCPHHHARCWVPLVRGAA